jgi:hypothetical protein
MRKRTLKIWNGRWLDGERRDAHVYVAAYSRPDIRALFVELGLHPPSISEIAVYWSPRCWGTAMDGITPERGVWIQQGRNGLGLHNKPQRVVPP